MYPSGGDVYLGCINEWQYNGEHYIATKLVKYYTEYCNNVGEYHIGNYGSYRIISKFKYDDTTVGCTENCASIISSEGFFSRNMYAWDDAI